MAEQRSSSPSPPASSPAPPRKMPRRLPGAGTAAAEDGDGSPPPPVAGFIFMCSGATKPECYSHRVLGLPRGRLPAVSRIRRGAALFLYDFDCKHLYGPYRADSDGGLALVPNAFNGRYPAQVKFTIDGDFMPIPESSIRSAIKENYSKGKFSPELTFPQVEKLRALFRLITTLPESPPPHWDDGMHPASPAVYLPPSVSHHLPTSYGPAPIAAYAHPYVHLPPPTAQFTGPAYYMSAAEPYNAGYKTYAPLPATYQYMQAPPPYLCAQQYMPGHVPTPGYSTGPYYAAHQDGTPRADNFRSYNLESTSERSTYGTEQVPPTNLQLVRHYGSIPSSATAAPEAVVTHLEPFSDPGATPSLTAAATEATGTNLELVRSYGCIPSSMTGTLHAPEVNQPQQAASYMTHGAASPMYSYGGFPATSQDNNVAVPSVYVVAAAPSYQ